MGRLTLNMLLSFAQFEREVTGARAQQLALEIVEAIVRGTQPAELIAKKVRRVSGKLGNIDPGNCQQRKGGANAFTLGPRPVSPAQFKLGSPANGGLFLHGISRDRTLGDWLAEAPGFEPGVTGPNGTVRWHDQETQQRSRIRESCTSGSVRGASSNRRLNELLAHRSTGSLVIRAPKWSRSQSWEAYITSINWPPDLPCFNCFNLAPYSRRPGPASAAARSRRHSAATGSAMRSPVRLPAAGASAVRRAAAGCARVRCRSTRR
jgi:hypothetical protein